MFSGLCFAKASECASISLAPQPQGSFLSGCTCPELPWKVVILCVWPLWDSITVCWVAILFTCRLVFSSLSRMLLHIGHLFEFLVLNFCLGVSPGDTWALLLTPFSGITLGWGTGNLLGSWGLNIGHLCVRQVPYPLYYLCLTF